MNNENVFNELAKKMAAMSRFERELLESKLYNHDTEFIEGYKYAACKALTWFNKKMYCLMIDGDSTLGEQFKNEMLEGL